MWSRNGKADRLGFLGGLQVFLERVLCIHSLPPSLTAEPVPGLGQGTLGLQFSV